MGKLDQLRELRERKLHGSRGGRKQSAGPPGVLGITVAGLAPSVNGPAGVASCPRGTKRGRPLAKDKHKTLAALRPWEKEGMSRRTWYRRRREGK